MPTKTKTRTNSEGHVQYLNWPRDNKSKNREWLKGRSKILSGYCTDYPEGGVNRHEGTKPKNWRNNPLPVCPHWETCPCSCHERIDQMFEATGLERRLMNNPDYEPFDDGFVIPDLVEDPLGESALTIPVVPVTVDIEQDVVTAQEPATRPLSPTRPPLAQRRTETGRAAKGGLEAQVWDALNNITEKEVTPKQTAEWIVGKYVIPTPSSGAINAVWDRWEKLGFCTQAKKPNRFTGFTGDGSWEELSRMKAKTRTNKRLAKGAAMRDIRPRR